MGFSFGKSEQLFKDAMHPHPECEAFLKEGEQEGRIPVPAGSAHEDRSIARNVSCKEAARELKAGTSGKRLFGDDYQRRFYSLALNKYPENVERWMSYRLRYEKIHEENWQAIKKGVDQVVDGALEGLSKGVFWVFNQMETGGSWALDWAFAGYDRAIALLKPPKSYASAGPPRR